MRKLIVFTAVCLLLGLSGLAYVSTTGPAQAQIAAQPAIVLYSGIDFTGRSLRVIGTLFDMPVFEEGEGVFDWNDQVGSIVVESGTWRLYQHGRANTQLDDTDIALFDVTVKAPARGWSAVVSATSQGPLTIADPAVLGIGMDISSVELISSDNLPDWTAELRH